jgi:small subunit ribosomal protein S1
MTDPNIPDPQPTNESTESFKDVLSQYEKSHVRKPTEGGREGTVIAVSAESVFFDIGFKTEGIMPLAAFQGAGETVKPGDKFLVNVKGRDPEGYYELVRGKLARPTDWTSLEKSFNEKATIAGTVTGLIKGGLSVDVGVRAFLPASRSGTRDAAELEKLVGQEIRCRIIKLDVTDEDVVVDRRVISEEEEKVTKDQRYGEVKEGATVHGTVRSLTDYGAFVDIGGVDGLLHVSDISWQRVAKPSDVLTVGQEVEARVLKIDPEKRRISLGLKQLQPHPWDAVSEKYKAGERVRGVVTRIADFGAFVELEPGIEGLIHISEMAWGKKVRRPDDVVKPGHTVEAVILGVSAGEKRISLGLKQALGDPWADADRKFPTGAVVEGPVTRITKFGAFVELAEGVEGMIHVSEISAEKRINHPQDVLRQNQVVKAQVLAVDREKRQLRLSIKQLAPSGLDEYIAEHKEGDIVSGRLIEASEGRGRVELGEGIQAKCRLQAASADRPAAEARDTNAKAGTADLSSLSSMLQARWKAGAPTSEAKPEAIRPGQILKFRIVKLDPAAKTLELELSE